MKHIWVITFVLVFSSCKKTLPSYSSLYVEPLIVNDSYSNEPTASAQLSENLAFSEAVSAASLKKNSSTPLTNTRTVSTKKELKKYVHTVQPAIKKTTKEDKEMDPRLSRALVMTIFGGVAAGLGIVFFKYAPTGLFIFAFSIVFLVGLVSLILYLANPKPKL